MSKTPLPHDTRFETWVGGVTHDALLQSQRFAQTEAGKRSISVRLGDHLSYKILILTDLFLAT